MSITLFALVGLAAADMHGKGFLGKRPKVLVTELSGVIADVLGRGHGVTKDRLSNINRTLYPMFRALPKNNRGHLSEPIMRYAMRRYFSATHGWIVKGFEEYGDVANVTTSDVDILQSKVPGFVRSALEQRFQHEGFALDDIVSMIAVVESLAFNEVVSGVEISFYLNSFEMGQTLSDSDLKEMLTSYLITEMLEGTSDREQHMSDKQNIFERYPNWDNALVFLKDISGSDGFARHSILNPVTENRYSFEDVVRMAGRISEEFGPWSNYECHDMKDILVEKDVYETGRVKIADFYTASKDGAWQFLEPSEHLRQLGAFDESSSYLGPQVIIPNYITGMSNCITSAEFFSICCLNECDFIYQHIEDEIQYQNATVDQILQAVSSLPTFPTVPEKLINKLEEIAQLDGGIVPLHGRLFAQWLHFTFPRDCPYPHVAGTISPKTQVQWRESVGEEAESVSLEEIQQHTQAEQAKRGPSPDAGAGMWDFHETIMENSTPSDAQDESFAQFLRFCSQIVIVSAMASILVREGVKVTRQSKKELAGHKL